MLVVFEKFKFLIEYRNYVFMRIVFSVNAMSREAFWFFFVL